MLPYHQVETCIDHCSQDQKDIILELRNLVVKAAPDAVEVTHSRGFSYFHADRGGPVSAGICQIGIFPDHIRLAFIHGSFIKDPLRLLEGSSKYKKYIRINSYVSAPWDVLLRMIEESAHFDPRTLMQT